MLARSAEGLGSSVLQATLSEHLHSPHKHSSSTPVLQKLLPTNLQDMNACMKLRVSSLSASTPLGSPSIEQPPARLSETKIPVNARIVVVGASDCGLRGPRSEGSWLALKVLMTDVYQRGKTTSAVRGFSFG